MAPYRVSDTSIQIKLGDYRQTASTFPYLKQGDLVSYRSGNRTVFARIVEVRGPGVFRVDAPGFVLVTRSNFVSQLFPVDIPK